MGIDGQRRWRRTACVAAAVTAVAGCGVARPADRSGGDTVVLRMATIDGEVNGNGQLIGPETFVEQLDEVSGGRLRVEVATAYGDGAADAESRIVEAIASGDLDGGWPSTRAFARAGIRGLEAVEAPMTLTSSAAVGALVTGPAGTEALDLLDGSGVVGLALTAGPLRRPFATGAPLLAPEDWAGQRFRVFNSPVQAATVTALGGTPADVGVAWVDEVRAGTLRGAEFDVAQYAVNGLASEAGAVTADVVLWPKVFVLALSEERFGSLSGEQREWVRQAAERATRASVEDAPADDARAQELCGRGVRFVPAGEEQVAALEAAVAPVVDGLAADPVTAPLLERVRAIAQEHPGVDEVEVAPSCQAPAPPGEPAVPSETAAVPEGLYRVELTDDDVREAGHDNGPGWTGTWTLEVEDGTYVLTCRAIDRPGRDCGNSTYDGPLEAGQLRGRGNTASFVWDGDLMAALTGCELPASTAEDGSCYPLDPYTLEWTLDGDRLGFRQVGGPTVATFTIEPWQRIG